MIRAALLCTNEGCVALLRAGRVAVVVLGSQLWGGLILKRHYLAPEKAMLVRIDKEFSWLRMLDSPVGSQDVRALLKCTGSPPLNSLPGNPIKPVHFKGPVRCKEGATICKDLPRYVQKKWSVDESNPP